MEGPKMAQVSRRMATYLQNLTRGKAKVSTFRTQ